ncbi:MAG: SGNH/GDSL hydrolase family protein [Thermodesulfobacteriota bacterium]
MTWIAPPVAPSSCVRVLALIILNLAPPRPLWADSGSLDVAGDSITKGFNAQSAAPCPHADQESLSWATGKTDGATLCGDGGEGVFSLAERLECRQGEPLARAEPNSAVSGARMKDFPRQASRIATFLRTQPPPRYTVVWLGHNDVCGGTVEKRRPRCAGGDDQDPDNYCRTTPAAFEREFRKGLDMLITVPQLQVGVAALVRVSLLCNHGEKPTCRAQEARSCSDLWKRAVNNGRGGAKGICGSLTAECSEQRIIDAYETAKAYRDILARVTAEYATIAEGGASRVVTVGGETVGGARKAVGVTMRFSEAPWVYKFTGADLSCCDCFHPSVVGQNTAARILFEGFTCTPTDVCCADADSAFADGLCTGENVGGTFVPGLF